MAGKTPHSPKTFDSSTSSRLVVKIAVAFSGLVLVLIFSFGLFSYHNHSQLILKNLQDQLQLAANTIAISIDGDKYETLQGRSSMAAPEYREIKSTLEAFMINDYLGFETDNIYTFRQISEDSLEFTVMLHDRYVGNKYQIRDEMRTTLTDGKPSFTGIYEDENGMWLSAYAAIINSRNEVVGLVEVDFRNNVYLMALSDEIYSMIFFLVIGVVLAIVVAILLSRLIVRPVVQVSRAALQFSQGNYEGSVAVRTKDEIGMLARAFNYMVKEVQEKDLISKKNRELTEAYEALDSVNRSLQEANRLKSEFLSIAAHDLKSPLQVIMGYAEHILTRRNQHPDVYRDAQKIFEASERMLGIIKNLLDTTAIESGKLILNKRLVDVVSVAKEVINNNQPLAQKKEQALILSANSACEANIDPKRMYEILDNLINNAIKFSPTGESIYVRIKASKNGHDNSRKVLMEIEDNGQGFTAEDLSKMFGKFMRLSAQPTAGETSTGLGLSVVKQLVELHGGKVRANSKGQGKGATFVVEIS